MQVRVFDTQAKGEGTYKFNVLVHEDKSQKDALIASEDYLKDIDHKPISKSACRYVRVQTATPDQAKAVANGGEKIGNRPPVNQGYVIIKISENCP